MKRVVDVAGGKRKTNAIRGTLARKLVNVMITDLASAERLLAASVSDDSNPANGASRMPRRTVKAR